MFKWIAVFIIPVLAFWGCQTSTDPAGTSGGGALIQNGEIGGIHDSIAADSQMQLIPKIQFASGVDTGKVKYSWSVLDGDSAEVLTNAVDKILSWIPSKPGKYAVSLTLEYEGRTAQILVFVVVLSGDNGAATLDWYRKGVVGNWKGTVTTPWVLPYGITMTLRDSGTYSAHANPPQPGDSISPQVALYYGTDEDSPEKVYQLNDVLASGEAAGNIAVVFFPGDVVNDELRNVVLSRDKSHLSFDMYHLGTYGPVHADLQRVP